MVVVVNVKSLQTSSTPLVYDVFATVVIIAVVLVGVVTGNFAVLSSFFVALVVEFVIVVPSLMSLSLPFLSSMQSYMAVSYTHLTLPTNREV